MNLNFLICINKLSKLFYISYQLIKRGEYRGYDYIHQQQKVTWLEGGGVLIENLELTYGEKLFNAAPEDFRKQVVIEYNEWFRWLV